MSPTRSIGTPNARIWCPPMRDALARTLGTPHAGCGVPYSSILGRVGWFGVGARPGRRGLSVGILQRALSDVG
jgi:hypothetical protein